MEHGSWASLRDAGTHCPHACHVLALAARFTYGYRWGGHFGFGITTRAGRGREKKAHNVLGELTLWMDQVVCLTPCQAGKPPSCREASYWAARTHVIWLFS